MAEPLSSHGSNEVQRDEPCYVISVAARMVGVHAQTLRYYERIGLVADDLRVHWTGISCLTGMIMRNSFSCFLLA